MRYPTIFHLLSSVFSKKGAVCVLIDGFAVNFHKVARATVDVDFLTTREHFETVWSLLEKEGFRKFSEQETFTQLKNGKGYLKDLDFMFVDKDVLDKIVKEAKQVTIAGLSFYGPVFVSLDSKGNYIRKIPRPDWPRDQVKSNRPDWADFT